MTVRSALRTRRPLLVLAVFVVAAVPRVATAGTFITTDEPTWMARSQRFSQGILDGTPEQMSASLGETATMPGVAPMWTGTFARLFLAIGDGLGIADGTGDITYDRTALEIAQTLAALLNAALIAALFLLLLRWAGTVAAAFVALVLATEPWIVGLGSVLHTDHTAALFGTCGIVALALALGVPEPSARSARPLLLAGISGLLLVQAPLTKISALGFVPVAGVFVAMALVSARRRVPEAPTLDEVGRVVAVALGAAVVSVPLAWPGLVADFPNQIEYLRQSVGLGGTGHRQFFRGEVTDTPGPWFYVVATPLRMTPWLMVALATLVPAALWHRRSRSAALLLLVGLAPMCAVLTVASKQFDRYALLVMVPLVVVAGLGAGELARSLPSHRLRKPAGAAVAAAVVAAALVHTLSVAPHGLAYFNPALGGGDRAVDEVLIGWGEGFEVAAELIRELEGGDCEGVTTEGAGAYLFYDYPCLGVSVDGEWDYAVSYISSEQRNPNARARISEGRELVGIATIRGIDYVYVFR